ncbi:MAG: hypothetical protein HOP23_05605 [Methylococcaceae bacterium]|nr:hypothetical protein [Methylococcaceae bacterium]
MLNLQTGRKRASCLTTLQNGDAMCIATDIECLHALAECVRNAWLRDGVDQDRRHHQAFLLLCEALTCLSSAAINLGRDGVIRGHRVNGPPTVDVTSYHLVE